MATTRPLPALSAASSTTASTTATTTTVAVPDASTTPFNIYTRSTVPSFQTAITLGIIALALAAGGTYLLATRNEW